MVSQVLPIRIGAVSQPCTGQEGWRRWVGYQPYYQAQYQPEGRAHRAARKQGLDRKTETQFPPDKCYQATFKILNFFFFFFQR